MYMSVALSNSSPTSVFTKQILQRQHGVIDLSSPTTYNNTDWVYFFTTKLIKNIHFV